jgi:alpha-glucosidase
MLCDAPSVYEREPEITTFISKIPTVWDKTKVLEAKMGQYLIEARQTGNIWYVAGLTGDLSKTTFVDFSFLNDGKYVASILKDGPNSEKIGTDYLFESVTVDKNSVLPIKMVNGGGFVIRVSSE